MCQQGLRIEELPLSPMIYIERELRRCPQICKKKPDLVARNTNTAVHITLKNRTSRDILRLSTVGTPFLLARTGRARDRLGPQPGASDHDQVRHHQHPRTFRPQGRP